MTFTAPICSLLRFLALPVAIISALHDANGQSAQPAQPPLEFSILHLVPYGFVDDQGKETGYFHDMATELLTRADIPFRISLKPLPRLFRDTRQGITHCLFIADTDATNKVATMIEPIGRAIRGGFVSLPGRTLSSYNDLSALRIGVPAGVAFFPRFDNDNSLRKIRVPNYSSGVEMLVRNRIDTLIGNVDSFYYHATQTGRDGDSLFAKPLVFVTSDIMLACSKSSPPDDAVTRNLQTIMRDMRLSGRNATIMQKYGIK